ncbi:MAG TPA: protein kinase [Planctomycetaceae bacterium]|nr:protein kinase [Planctomycetaceae bacterium]
MSDQIFNHPQREQLLEYGLGKLDPDKSDLIESHLAECDQCGETLLNLQDDTFVNLLRRSDAIETPTENSERDRGVVPPQVSVMGATFVEKPAPSKGELDLPASLADHPRYRIVDLLGKGGMGDVYQAEHIVMNRPVALKIINRELVKKSQAVERFRREVHAAARLSHPNIVTAHDAEQAGDLHFLVMEFVDGIDLSRLVKERGALPVHEACDYARQAALGMQHAHEQGMVHRDIKPHNLMVTADGTVKILDFGLAGFATESALMEAEESEGAGSDSIPLHLTTVGSVMGTPDYIAPEQARDAHSADIRADIYSLGCTLYFLLTGQPPHNATTVIEKLRAHAEHEPPAIELIRVDVPDELAEVIRRMMAKDPVERFQTPQEVADALDRVSAQLRSISGTHPPQDFTVDRPTDAPEHWQNIKSLADILLSVAFLNMVWIAIVFSNVYFNLGGFTLSPFWERLGAPLFYTSLVGLPLSLMLGFGAWRMRRFQSYGWSMAAAILAMIPVTPVNIVLGLICGPWAMVLLFRPEVKRMFVARDESQDTGTSLVQRSRSTAPGSVHSGAGRIPRWVVGVGFFSFACMLAGIFYIQIGTTTLKFEVLDPDIQVRFAGESVVFQDRNGADSIFTVKPGTTQEFVVEQNGAVVETDSLVLNRGDRVVLKIDVVEGEIRITPSKPKLNVDRTPHAGQDVKEETEHPSIATVASPKTREQFEAMIAATRAAETDEELQGVVAGYTPMLSLLSQDAGGDLIELLAELPDEMHEALLLDGYLKWKADELDEKRKRVMLDMFAAVLSQAPNTENTRKKLEQLDAYANVSDVGFAVIGLPESDSQVLVWYFLRRDVKFPTVLMLSGSTSTALQEALKPDNHQEIRKRTATLIEKQYSDLPPAPAALPQTVAELKALIENIPREGSDEEWKTFLGQNAPPIEDFPVEFLRNPLQLIAGLPAATRQELLDRGYLKWRLSELDEERRELNRELIKELLESAMKSSGLDDQTIEKIIERRQASGDVGFVVATVPTTNSQIIVWYMQNPDSPPIPIPMMVPILGVKAEFKDQALSKSVYRQISGVDEKPYTELPPVPLASREIRESLRALLNNLPEGEVSDEVWIEYLSEYSPFMADPKAPQPLTRNLIRLLDSLPKDSIDTLLEQGFVKWPHSKLDKTRQEGIRAIMQGVMSAVPPEHRGEKVADLILSSLVTADVGFAVLKLPDSEKQFVAFFAQMPTAFGPTILPVLGDLSDTEFKEINSPAVQKQIENIVKQLDSSLPASTLTTGFVPQSTIEPETRRAFHELIVAARAASTDEEWVQVLAKHAPMLALTEESETEQFGKVEMALMSEGGRILIELLAGLPDTVHNDLLQASYLKWSFKELDKPRREAMQAALTKVLSASDKMGFPAGLTDRVPDMLASGDVGFAVAETPEGETLLWYLLLPEVPIPILFPLFGTPQQGEANGVSLTKSVFKQIGDLENKPYSDLPENVGSETSVKDNEPVEMP